MKLPHPSSESNWISNFEYELDGFLQYVFTKLSKFSIKDCNHIIDSMAIRKQIIWNGAEQKYHEFCDLGNLQVKHDVLAMEALVFMLVSLKQNWKVPIGYFFSE